jgi:NAD(P)-dependent dehydrogenase (short-subunit alcohol dehydrogenase family)
MGKLDAALEYGGRGIRINAIGPGSMWTPGLRAAAEKDPRHVEQLQALTPMAGPYSVSMWA